jgi:hypothetical protein
LDLIRRSSAFSACSAGNMESRRPRRSRRISCFEITGATHFEFGHGSNQGYSPVCPAYPRADFRGMRELSAKIIYSILRTQRIGHPNVTDSSKCNRAYGFGLTKLEKLSFEWLQTSKDGKNIHASLENRPFLHSVTQNGLILSHARKTSPSTALGAWARGEPRGERLGRKAS